MQIETSRFGDIDIEEENIITFPEGLPGFEGYRRFTLVPHPGQDKSGPFKWMQSVDEGELAFLAMEPGHCFPAYEPRLPQSDLEAISLSDNGLEPRLYTLLTVPKGDPCGITANLMAPVIVNPVARLARQVIVSGDDYGLRHRLLPDSAA